MISLSAQLKALMHNVTKLIFEDNFKYTNLIELEQFIYFQFHITKKVKSLVFMVSKYFSCKITKLI